MRREVIGAATPWVRIYALAEYPSGRHRYVGKTVQYLHERHKAHIRLAKRQQLPRLPVHRWLRKQISSGAMLEIRLLENVAGDDWQTREKHWIERLRAEGHDLLNLTLGGEGLAGLPRSPEHRAKIAAALRTGSHVECGVCGRAFWAKRNEIAKGHAKYCSKRCSNARHKGPPLL